MNKTELFEAIEELVKKTNPPVNFKEIFVTEESLGKELNSNLKIKLNWLDS